MTERDERLRAALALFVQLPAEERAAILRKMQKARLTIQPGGEANDRLPPAQRPTLRIVGR